jgi:hypothetical protein
LDAPAVVLPEVSVELAPAAQPDFTLLEAFTKTVRSLSADIFLERSSSSGVSAR